MHRDPPYQHRLSHPVAAALLLTFLAGCAASVPDTLAENPGGSSLDAVEQAIRDARSENFSDNTDMAEAWAFVDARDCDQAMPIARAVLSEDINDVDGRLVQAECAAMTDEPAIAAEHYEQVLTNLREPRALRGLGVLRARAGRYDEAQVLLLEASTLAPDDWRTWNALGFVSDVEGDWSSAAVSYQRAAGLAPARATPLNNLGLSYLQQGETRAAIDAFNQAIARDPEFAAASENLRMALIFDGQLETALWGLEEEQRPIVLNNAGVVARSQGNTELAGELFQRALDESPVFYERAYNNLRALGLPGHAGYLGQR